MKMKYLTIIYYVFILAVITCCENPGKEPLLESPPMVPDPTLPQPDPDPEPGPAPEEAIKLTCDYFKSQLDKEEVELSPSFLYGPKIESVLSRKKNKKCGNFGGKQTPTVYS